MTKRTRFTALLDRGFTRSEAAQRVKVRSRSTAKRWHDAHLAAQAPEPAASPEPTRDEMEPYWEYCRRHGRSQPIYHYQGWKEAGRPSPIPDPPKPPEPAVPIHLVDWSRVQPDFGPLDNRTLERHRVAVAEEAAIGDPFSRHLTDEERARAPQAWADWQDQRVDAVRREIQAEQREAQKERDRRAHLLSLPTFRPRHRL